MPNKKNNDFEIYQPGDLPPEEKAPRREPPQREIPEEDPPTGEPEIQVPTDPETRKQGEMKLQANESEQQATVDAANGDIEQGVEGP